jgi:type IV pilus assembly protein PilW
MAGLKHFSSMQSAYHAHNPARSPHLQRGLSLVETMVGLTIGLFVVLAAVGTLAITRQGNTSVSDSFRLSTAGDLAMRQIEFTIRQAGATELLQTGGQGNPVIFDAMTLRAVNGNQVLSGTEGASGAPDSLIVSYQGRSISTTADCVGNPPPLASQALRIDNTFTLNGVELQCQGVATDGTKVTAIESPAQALVGDNNHSTDEVAAEDFQVWYWMQNPTSGDQIRVDQSKVVDKGGWPAVAAVEVCLQLRGVRVDYPPAKFLGCDGKSHDNGNRLHQTFHGTYKLRNHIT